MSTERDRLIPVRIFNVYPYAEGQQGMGLPQNFLVFLKGEEEDRVVPITIGQFEGQALLMAMQRIPLPRPLPHNLLQNLLQKMSAQTHKLVIHTLKDDVFHAYLLIETPTETFPLDCRPSDGMVLASLMGVPIFMSPEVMEEAGRILEVEQAEDGGQAASTLFGAAVEQVEFVPGDAQSEPAAEEATDQVTSPAERVVTDPVSELVKLKAQLTRLIAEEAYEEAARVRDQINELERT